MTGPGVMAPGTKPLQDEAITERLLQDRGPLDGLRIGLIILANPAELGHMQLVRQVDDEIPMDGVRQAVGGASPGCIL